MITVAGIMMVAIAIAAVAYPLVQNSFSSSNPFRDSSDGDLSELLARRDATYVALRELDMDYEMGKLAPSDYQALRDRYRAQAVVTLQELDSRQWEAQGADGDHTLQQNVAREVSQATEETGAHPAYSVSSRRSIDNGR